ncbi:piggyBac transposable element-derived protein 4-like [Nilaparvata lugens]|uniref:piggyBac transposable element-derived protein 4-like n=1 Tax=Nilaparvata lugens TaxID=108931 RepID=UPI00193D56D4|nr:piggyBac transposable element-derived protein 4-like [Nilaparvata lugens]
MRSRPAGAARGVTNAENLFSLFVNETIIDAIVKYTNQEILIQKVNYNDSTFTKETTNKEVRALLGLLIYFGALNHNHTSTKVLWHESRGLRITRTVMPLARFEFLINTLRFDDKLTRDARKEIDALAPIREVWDKFIEHCKEYYIPGPYCCIDEQLLAFRGNSRFRMYIPNKPAKYGLKLVMLCNSNGYLINAIPYTGKKMNTGGQPQAAFFVEKLSETIQGSNRNITVDNWFSSVPLFNDMLSKYNLTMVGKKNKNVLLLSNMHQGYSMQQNSKLPEIIHFYNNTKGGVDLLDQMSAQYSCSRKTRRWPVCLFYGILNSACVNSYIIYKENTFLNKQTPQPRVEFLFTLAEGLMKPWLEERLQKPTLRRGIRLAIAEQLGIDEPRHAENDNRRAGRCCICPRSRDVKTTIKCIECKMFVCKSHSLSICANCRE